ncbi:MAG: YggU family protein [Chloroflexi bacterium]|nr:YggU family protein [Chloroflexota bacterium]MBU1751009.1 YggU family protein [Chloroflexota bacterium]
MDIQEHDGAVTFAVRAVPRAKQSEVVGIEGGALKVRLTAPPVEGKANEALVRFLADALGVRRGDVSIVAGERARRKVVCVQGLTAAQARARLGLE